MKTLFDRLLAETSPFFKKLQIFLVTVLGLVNTFSAIVPPGYVAIINTVLITATIFCSLTVNDGAIFYNGFSLSALMELLPTIPAQLAELKQAIDGKITSGAAIQQAADTPVDATQNTTTKTS